MRDGAISFEVCRPVESHARLMMDWRNDPVTLAMFYHREPKVWESFWPEFRDTYFVHATHPAPVFACADGRRVGFLRFQPVKHPRDLAGRSVDVSINIAPDARGQRLGTQVLRQALDYLRGAGIDSVYAEVRRENTASLKAFEAAGFEVLGPARKQIPDTGEECEIVRFLAELVSPFWRRRVYVIAEAGSNWRMGNARRDLAMARALIDVAVEAGADAVKFQTYRPETVYVANAGQSEYLAAAGIREEIRDIFADLAMPYEMVPELAGYCRKQGIDFLSTPFSPDDFAAIDPYVRVHKIASYEISHVHLLRLAARSGKPLVLSTGASTEPDIAWAVETFHGERGRDLCLLQCTAKYPAPLATLNLRTIPWLRQRFGVPAGLSDHSRDPVAAPVMAVALGARVIEKHYTLDNRLPGPDHSFALTPPELAQMVRAIRAAEESLGDGVKEVLPAERELAAYARRGLQATAPIAAGEVLREGKNFAILRPGQQKLGAHPRYLDRVEGRVAIRPMAQGEGIALDDGANRALLLDLDGTLADSLSLMRLVYGRFLEEHHAAPTDAEFARLNGPPLAQVVRLLAEMHQLQEDPAELLARYHRLIDEAYLEVSPAPGARTLLEHARASGYTVGVVTSNSARRTRAWLERAGLSRLIDVLVAEEDVLRGKPNPEPYLMAADRAGCPAAASVAVEDSPQGAAAARGAGMRTFVVGHQAGAQWPEGVERIASLDDLKELL
jgi:HAD superfamily hydrolase (TIGR01509 family)